MLTYIIIAIIAAVVLIPGIIFAIRIWRFKPNPDKKEQLKQLNADLEPTGFAYNDTENYFYALNDCWQRKTGYCRLYDEGAPLFNMIMDCEPITFSYGGKRWLIELWKGQYGITTGAEVGIYNTTRGDILSEKFSGTFYEAADDSERMKIAFVLRKNKKVLLKRSALHWWLTAFKLGEFSEKNSLTMDVKIKFLSRAMRTAFVDALKKLGYNTKDFSVRNRTVLIHYTKPHSKQPLSQQGVQEEIAQHMNKQNCKLYRAATAEYPDTLDQLEYIKTALPELYHFMLNSLYAKGFFESFDWLLDLVFGSHRPKPPYPPKPPKPHCSCCHIKGREMDCKYYFKPEGSNKSDEAEEQY